MNSLLKKEALLQAQIDTLQSEIDALEKKVDLNQHQETQLSRKELKQFKAPEWCIPIKANVMTFEWDVCMCMVCVCVCVCYSIKSAKIMACSASCRNNSV